MPSSIFDHIWPKGTTIAVKIKDIILVVGFLVTIGGWYRSSIVSKSQITSEITILKNNVTTLSTAVNGNTEQLVKVNENLLKQNELNGKIILFMELKK